MPGTLLLYKTLTRSVANNIKANGLCITAIP